MKALAFRLSALFLVPALLFVGLEGSLRIAGWGNPATFWLPLEGETTYTTNQRFGDRFFPPHLARTPQVQVLQQPKPEGTYRVFLLGGSAAMGTPDAAFGLARHLEAMLGDRYPGTTFEVWNAAMTAINSHVVRIIGGDCLALDPDLLVIYLGNNEVVGPYGPGTVFESFSSSLTLIRMSAWAKATRTGQLVAAIAASSWRGADGPAEWAGLSMFRERKISEDDPRLERTYGHMRRNVADLIEEARGQGVPVLLSTVATNLVAHPPFSSREGAGPVIEESHLLPSDEAIDNLRQALATEEGSAELHYSLAQLLRRTGRVDGALDHFVRARDTDLLRFRADSKINQTLRLLGDREGVTLVDADRIFTEAQLAEQGQAPDLFWEHVHLTFDGNFRLASALAESLRPLLPLPLQTARDRGTTPSLEGMARRLGVNSWHQFEMLDTMGRLLERPPFNSDPSQVARVRRWRAVRPALERSAREGLEAAAEQQTAAVERDPRDIQLRENLVDLLEEQGRLSEATVQMRSLLAEVPGVRAWMTRLAFLLAAQNQFDEARELLEDVADRSPRQDQPRGNLGFLLESQQLLDPAAEQYLLAIEALPSSLTARYQLAALRERQSKVGEAQAILEEAAALAPLQPEPAIRLGELFDRQQRFDEAIELYRKAIELEPESGQVHNNLGFILERTGRLADALRHYQAATEVDPGYALAYFNLADGLLAINRPAEAAETYRAGLELDPDNPQARSNLAIATEMTLGSR